MIDGITKYCPNKTISDFYENFSWFREYRNESKFVFVLPIFHFFEKQPMAILVKMSHPESFKSVLFDIINIYHIVTLAEVRKQMTILIRHIAAVKSHGICTCLSNFFFEFDTIECKADSLMIIAILCPHSRLCKTTFRYIVYMYSGQWPRIFTKADDPTVILNLVG